MAHDFIGSGWAFPVHVDRRGGIALVSGRREIEQSIHLILKTMPGERAMRPEFGCRIHDLVFAPADITTAGQIAYEVRESLRRWEPRIDVLDVEVTIDPDRTGTLYIDLTYALRDTNDRRNLVFPFYVIPGEESSAAAGGRTADHAAPVVTGGGP